MEEQFLKNIKTGCVFRSTPILEKKKGLVPCADPRVKPIKKKKLSIESPEDLLQQETGTALVQEWFGREVGDVTIAELKVFAEDKGIELAPGRPKKLELVMEIDQALTQEV